MAGQGEDETMAAGYPSAPDAAIAFFARHDIIDQSERPDIRHPADTKEAIERSDPADPTLPMESTEPIEPIESIELREPMQRTEF